MVSLDHSRNSALTEINDEDIKNALKEELAYSPPSACLASPTRGFRADPPQRLSVTASPARAESLIYRDSGLAPAPGDIALVGAVLSCTQNFALQVGVTRQQCAESSKAGLGLAGGRCGTPSC